MVVLMKNDAVCRLKIYVAGANELGSIYRLRHDVYATELGQYESRSDESLPDTDDVASVYVLPPALMVNWQDS
jgi:hypothetical protein